MIGVGEGEGEVGGKGKGRVSADLRCVLCREGREKVLGRGWVVARGWRAGGEQGAMPVWFCFQKVSVGEYLLVHGMYGKGGGFAVGEAGRETRRAVVARARTPVWEEVRRGWEGSVLDLA